MSRISTRVLPLAAAAATLALPAVASAAATITSGPGAGLPPGAGFPGYTLTGSATWTVATDPPGGAIECRIDEDAWEPCTSPVTANGLAEGQYVFSVRTAGGTAAEDGALFRVDLNDPAGLAVLEPANGSTVTDPRPVVRWSAATDRFPDPVHHIVYGLTIDGSTPPGRIENCFLRCWVGTGLRNGVHTVTPSATDDSGRTATASSTFTVAAPPELALEIQTRVVPVEGIPGATDRKPWVLAGRRSTVRAVVEDNDLGTLSVRWDMDATAATRPAPSSRLPGWRCRPRANDGGFRRARRVALRAVVPWTLARTGSDRVDRTVYVRFEGDAQERIFQDDVALDRTRSAVVRATLAQGRRRAVLRIAARDGRSGVAGFQVRRPGARPGPWRASRPSARVRVSAGVVLVRVRDRAGNVSPWRVTRP